LRPSQRSYLVAGRKIDVDAHTRDEEELGAFASSQILGSGATLADDRDVAFPSWRDFATGRVPAVIRAKRALMWEGDRKASADGASERKKRGLFARGTPDVTIE